MPSAQARSISKNSSERESVLPIQPPHGAVGEHAPLHGAVRHHVGAAEVAQHLRGGRIGVGGLGAVAPVEWAQPALGFQNGQAVAVAAVVFGLGQRGGLFGAVGKQQAVGHVFAALAREVDLGQKVVVPAQRHQHLVDDQRLGLRFIDAGLRIQRRKNALQRRAKGGEGGFVECLVGWCLQDAARQEVLGKKLALHMRRILTVGAALQV